MGRRKNHLFQPSQDRLIKVSQWLALTSFKQGGHRHAPTNITSLSPGYKVLSRASFGGGVVGMTWSSSCKTVELLFATSLTSIFTTFFSSAAVRSETFWVCGLCGISSACWSIKSSASLLPDKAGKWAAEDIWSTSRRLCFDAGWRSLQTVYWTQAILGLCWSEWSGVGGTQTPDLELALSQNWRG